MLPTKLLNVFKFINIVRSVKNFKLKERKLNLKDGKTTLQPIKALNKNKEIHFRPKTRNLQYVFETSRIQDEIARFRLMNPPQMATVESFKNKKNLGNTSNPRLLQEYVEALQTQLAEEQEQKEALSLERAKLKVCWEMTLEELASTRSELSEKIMNLETELQKQLRRRKLLQKLVHEYEKNMDEMKGVIENIIERPKCKF